VLVGLLQSATGLALRLAAPVLVTMFIVDVVLGFVGKTIPQINVMTAGLPLRALAGVGMLIIALTLTSQVIGDSMLQTMKEVGKSLSPLPPGREG
jgi:flagellar biosynthetic protein FliR